MKVLTISKFHGNINERICQWITKKEFKKNYNIPLTLPDYIINQIKGVKSHYIKDRILDFLYLLEDKYSEPHRLFPSRSEFIRCAMLFDDLKHPKYVESLKNLYKNTIKLDNYKPPEYLKKVKKPKNLIILDKYDIDSNLIISWLFECKKLLGIYDLEEYTGLSKSTLWNSIQRIKKKYPNLIHYERKSKHFEYALNHDILLEVISSTGV